MNFYNYIVDLPFSKIKINFRELNTNEQLILAKANLSFGDDKESFYDYHNFVLSVINKCVKNKKDLMDINIIEYILFLTKLKIISNGSQLEFFLNSNNKNKTKVKIDLKNYLSSLYNASCVLNDENNIITENNIEIKLNWPNIKSILTFFNFLISNKNNDRFMEDTTIEFIEHILIKKNKILIKNFNFTEKNEFFNQLPCSIRLKIIERVCGILEKLFEHDLFDISLFKDQKFNFYNLSFIEHIKLFFSYDVKSIHQEIYFLSSLGLPPEYTLKISPNERKLYFSIIQEHKKEQNKESSPEDMQFNQNTNSNSLKNLSLEFGEDVL